MNGARIRIGELRLTLPSDYAGDAQGFARALKAELSRAGPGTLERLARVRSVNLTAQPDEPPEFLARRIVSGVGRGRGT